MILPQLLSLPLGGQNSKDTIPSYDCCYRSDPGSVPSLHCEDVPIRFGYILRRCAVIQALARGLSSGKKSAAVRPQQMADEVLLQDNLKTMKLQTTRSDRIKLEDAEVELDLAVQQVELTTAGKHKLSVYDASCRSQGLSSRTRSARVSTELMCDAWKYRNC